MCVCECMPVTFRVSCSGIFSAYSLERESVTVLWSRLTVKKAHQSSCLSLICTDLVLYVVSSLYACSGDWDPDHHYFRASAWTQWPISRVINSFTGKHCTLLMHLITKKLSLLLICLDKNNRNYTIIFLLHLKSPCFLMGRKQYNSGNIMLNH